MTWPRKPAVRRAITQNLIVSIALEMLKQSDLDSVSMRRIAQSLSTGPASLYAHVSSKEELHELMLDELLGMIEMPEPDPDRWQEQLKEVARKQLAVLTAHPGIARIAMETTVPTGPNSLRHGEGVLALLLAGGVPDRVAALAFDTVAQWVSAFAVEVSGHKTGEIDQDDMQRRMAQIEGYMTERAAEFPNLISLGPTLSSTSAEERFEFGLEVFLTGIAAVARNR
ncbi:MAG TPA: TetR/AcrR family transcriptional regulator [Actinophytocola sp.]|nr:TetR/AcrR family transcriptional regulator [Actinophytocola sp.]